MIAHTTDKLAATVPPAERLKLLRDKLGLSQADLANEFGVTAGAVAMWERNERSMTGSALRLLEFFEHELEPSETSKLESSALLVRRRMRAFSALALVMLSRAWIRAKPGTLEERVRTVALRHYIKTLGELKAVAMKLGQMFIYSSLLPEAGEDVAKALSEAAAPMPVPTVASIIYQSFGSAPSDLFAEWNPHPIAVGSIGQVHQATSHSGQALAVKVRHAGVTEAVLRDLQSVKRLDQAYCLVNRGQKPGVLHEEIKARILEECDYKLERGHQETFRQLFADHPYLRIPTVSAAHCSERVLTTAFVRGLSFSEFATTASAADRDRAGLSLWQFFWNGALRHGLFHADPHPNNFLFQDDKVFCIDFGRVKRLSPDFIVAWKNLIRAVFERDRSRVLPSLVALGAIEEHQTIDADHAHRALVACALPALRDAPFTFTDDYLKRAWRLLLADNPNHAATNVTADVVFMNQLQFGTTWLLARLGATISCRSQVLALLYEPGEKTPAAFTAAEIGELLPD